MQHEHWRLVLGLDPAKRPQVTKVLKDRLKRWLDGEWAQLWYECTHPPARAANVGVKDAEGWRRYNAARATHFFLNGHLREGRQALQSSGLLSMANPSVREQMHELNTPSTPPVAIHDPPADVDSNPRWSFARKVRFLTLF